MATDRYKLIRYPATDEWELFDLETDPRELRSHAEDPAYEATREELRLELERLRIDLGVPPEQEPRPGGGRMFDDVPGVGKFR